MTPKNKVNKNKPINAKINVRTLYPNFSYINSKGKIITPQKCAHI